MSTDIRLSKAQLSKIIQIGGFLGALLGKFSSPLMNVAVPLAKCFDSVSYYGISFCSRWYYSRT